jgi:hypothetical protein
VLGSLAINSQEAKYYIENVDGAQGGQYIYYTCFLRLTDLVPDLFTRFPMTKGVKFKITLTLNNNVSFQFQKNTAGALLFDRTKFNNVTSPINPLMLSASYNRNIFVSGTAINAITTTDTFRPSGSATLLNLDANTYSVSMKIGKNNGKVATLS